MSTRDFWISELSRRFSFIKDRQFLRDGKVKTLQFLYLNFCLKLVDLGHDITRFSQISLVSGIKFSDNGIREHFQGNLFK